MKAIVYNGSPVPVLEDRPVPKPADGQVLLKVIQAGICGTDLSILSGKHPRARSGLILGHEVSARVEEIRGQNTGLSVGDLVTVEPILSCGVCIACRSGIPHVCQKLRLYGIDEPGGMAEYLAVDAGTVRPVPNDVPEALAVLAEPMAVAVHAVRMSNMRFGDTVSVIGGGPIGIMIALLARDNGASTLIVSEPQETRRRVAEELGFQSIDPTQVSLEEYVAEQTRGAGVDIVFESAGSQAAVTTSTKLLRPRGMLVQVSIPKMPREFSLVDLTFKEISVRGVRVYEPFDFERALRFIAQNGEALTPLLSPPYSLDRAEEAFEAARAGDKGLRVIFSIGASQ